MNRRIGAVVPRPGLTPEGPVPSGETAVDAGRLTLRLGLDEALRITAGGPGAAETAAGNARRRRL